MIERGTCPACGYETLETIALEEETDLPLRRGITMFECTRCLWQGSTATLNPV